MEQTENKTKNNWLSNIKQGLGKQKSKFFGALLLLVGVAIGVGITTAYPQITTMIKSQSQLKPVVENVVDQNEVKKQALGKFYNEIITAQDKQDWASLYKLVRQSVRDNVTEAQFTAHYSEQMGKDKIVSRETRVNSIEVTGNTGTVNRTLITCLAKDCTGKNRTEENAIKPYEYVNGKWRIPDPEPSERALKAANYGYQNSSKSDQNDLLNQYGYGSDNSTFAVRNWAVYFDENLEELIRVETIVEQDKLDKSRPIYNQQPAQIIQQPAPIINQPAPIQQNTYPKHCTSNTIGDYTYTNCY